jgi:hypothetical protein
MENSRPDFTKSLDINDAAHVAVIVDHPVRTKGAD